MNLWLVMLLGGLLTYATRLSFIVLFGRIDIPAWLRRGLRFVPPAVLTAIIIPELIMHTGKMDISFSNTRLLAGIAAILVAWRTRNVILTIIAGMAILLLLQAILV